MTRKPDDWMPLHIGEYLADTTHLTRDQHGAYLLLLMAYWRRGGGLPADDAQLAAMAKATSGEWRRMKPIISGFFTAVDGLWHQKRADEELEKANRLTEAKSAAGKKGAAKKWQAHSTDDGKDMAEPSRSHGQNDAPLPSPEPKPVGKKKDNALTRFEEFWNACPKKTGKGEAEKAWLKAVALAPPETLVAAMRTYAAAQSGKDPAYIKTPGPWLNGKRWLDGVSSSGSSTSGSTSADPQLAEAQRIEREAIEKMLETAGGNA